MELGDAKNSKMNLNSQVRESYEPISKDKANTSVAKRNEDDGNTKSNSNVNPSVNFFSLCNSVKEAVKRRFTM